MKPEEKYKRQLVNRLQLMFPTSYILNNDPSSLQGVPDILILHKNKWAMLEVKHSYSANRQPNQQYYVDEFNKMSYASFIFPENEEKVLSELQSALGA